MKTVREIHRFAKRDRYGRLFLRVIWVGAFIATGGLANLAVELRRHPLVEVAR